MCDDGLTIGTIHARAVVEGQVAVTLDDGTPCEVLVPAGVGVPGATEEEFAAVLAIELIAGGRVLPPALDSSAVVASDPGLYDAIARRLESHWEQQGEQHG